MPLTALLTGLACAGAFGAAAWAAKRAWPGAVGPFGARLLAGLGAGVGLAAGASRMLYGP